MRKIILLCFFSWAFALLAQESSTVYPGDEAFIEQVAEKLKQSKNPVHKDRAKELINSLQDHWPSNNLSVLQKEAAFKFYTKLNEAKKSSFPLIYEYLKTINTFGKNAITGSSFDAWFTYLESLPHGKKDKRLLNALRFMSSFLDDNILYKKSYFTWYGKDPQYTMKFDTTLHINFKSIGIVCASRNDSLCIENSSESIFPRIQTVCGKERKG